jgi:VanZ family protein
MRAKRQWLWVSLYGGLLAVASLSPNSSLPSVHIAHMDKFVHFGMYAVLMVLLAAAMGIPRPHATRRTLTAVAICVTYGIFMEYAQLTLHFAGRTFSWADIAANTIGAATAAAALHGWHALTKSNGPQGLDNTETT